MSTESAGGIRRVVIDRPRLVARLAARFTHRVVSVVGNGGTGKSTLIAQAVDAEPREIDIVHACSTADADAAHLLGTLLRLVSDEGDHHDERPEQAIARRVLAHSPRQVCLVLDDSHLLPDGEAIERLLQTLPANGHLLIVGRRPPAIDLGRLDATGQLVEVGQDDLLMTSDELIDFANQRGVNIDLLAGAEGWPAFVELAASGSEVRSRRYLEEEALAAIAPERRATLARFAFVRGGDDDVARATTGHSLETLLADLPLVAWDHTEARLHDLWGELLIPQLSTDEQHEAATAASKVHRAAHRVDRAIELAQSVGDWDDIALTLASVLDHGVGGGVSIDQMQRWRRLAPPDASEDPVVMLLDGVIAREADPTSEPARRLLRAAADRLAGTGRHRLELNALIQWGYAARIADDLDGLIEVMTRVEALAADHAAARPYLAFGEAWTALASGRADLQLAALERIADADLSPIWATSRAQYTAHALFNLGRTEEALAAAPRHHPGEPVIVPGAAVTEWQALWFAGHPVDAMTAAAAGVAPGHSARDRFIANAWRAVMHAFAGDVSNARAALEIAAAHQGESPSLQVIAQTIMVETLIDMASGDDDAARERFRSALAFAPLGEGVSERTLRTTVAIPYVLLPETREFWDTYPLGPTGVETRALAQAFVAAREHGERHLLRTVHWPDAAAIAVAFPVRDAMALALHGVAAGRHEGRSLATYLCETWGDPARAALRDLTTDESIGGTAKDVAATTPAPPRVPPRIGVLGPPAVWHDGRPTPDPHWRRERVRALLTILTLRGQTTREQLAGTLWPDLDASAAAKNLRTTLNYLHNVLEPVRGSGEATWCVLVDGSSVRLNPALAVDMWEFRATLDAADEAERRGRPDEALPLLRDAVAMWRGDLAADLDLEALDLERIHLRSRFVRASCRATELLTAIGRAEEAIETARPALEVDRWHEPTYRALANAYTAVGDPTSARAVLERGEANLGIRLTDRP